MFGKSPYKHKTLGNTFSKHYLLLITEHNNKQSHIISEKYLFKNIDVSSFSTYILEHVSSTK